MHLTRTTIAAGTFASLALGACAVAMAAAPPKAGKAEAAPSGPAGTVAAAQATPTGDLRDVVNHVQWYRGRYGRIATGFEFDVPPAYHLAESNDARNLEMATGHPDDPDAVAWIVPLNQSLTNPAAWYVRVRWRGDGLFLGGSAELDPKQLEAAQSHPAEKRLASSGGTFKRFVEEPELVGHVIDWIEERTPASGKGTMFDCHAVRLARRGWLEFSIIGVNDAVAKTCSTTLHQFTDNLTFDETHEYPAQPGTATKAPYSLTSLVTQTK